MTDDEVEELTSKLSDAFRDDHERLEESEGEEALKAAAQIIHRYFSLFQNLKYSIDDAWKVIHSQKGPPPLSSDHLRF